MFNESPHSEEAEIGVLGSILMAEEKRRRQIMLECSHLSRKSFFVPRNGLLFEHLSEMYHADEPLDLLLLGESLRKHERLDAVGGFAFLEKLYDDTPTSQHAEHYIKIVTDLERRRDIISTSQDAIEECSTEKETEHILGDISSKIADITVQKKEDEPLADSMDESVEVLQNAAKGIVSGLPLPWPRFTKKTGGLQRGSVCPLLGRDGKGKSGCVSQIADFWLQNNIPFIVFSLEDVKRRLLLRMGGVRMGYSARSVETGHKTEDGLIFILPDSERQDAILKMRQYKSILEKAEEENKIFVFDDPHTVEELCALVKHHASVHKVAGVFIDGFKDILHSKGETETAREKHIAKELFKCAKETGVAMLPVSHVHDVPDDVMLSKRNIMGSKVQFQGARQMLIFQDAGCSQIEDEHTFVLSNTKSNYGFGGSVVLRRDENVFRYDEV